MIKKLAIIMSAMTFSVLLQGMEFKLSALKKTTNSDQGSKSRRKEDDEPKPDVRLNLDNIPEPMFISSSGKKSVKSLQQVNHLKSAQNTCREGLSTGRGSSDAQRDKINTSDINAGSREIKKNNDLRQSRGVVSSLVINNNDHDEDIFNDIGEIKRNDSANKKKRRSVLGEYAENNQYSSKEMWALVAVLNPMMYEFAQANQLSLDEVQRSPLLNPISDPLIYKAVLNYSKKKPLSLETMIEYAHLLEKFDIEPEAVAEFLQEHRNSGVSKAILMKKYKDIQNNKPELYMQLALDFITRTCDDGGIKESSPIHETHVAIQNDTIAEQKRQLKYQYIALGVGLVTTICGYAWGIVGQIVNPPTPTSAPTNNPTNIPTYGPTGMPTYLPTQSPI